MGETEIVPHHHVPRTQAPQQCHEIGAGVIAQRLVETQQPQGRQFAARQRPPALAKIGQARRRILRPEILARQRLEAQHGRRQAELAAQRQGTLDQGPMPDMQAVETADGQHAAPGRRVGGAADQAHGRARRIGTAAPTGFKRLKMGRLMGRFGLYRSRIDNERPGTQTTRPLRGP